MIKKMFLPVIILLISVLIVINYLAYKSPKTTKFITQNKLYSLTEVEDFNVLLYANRVTAYQKEESFKDIYLTNLDESKKLKLEIKSINLISEYKYLEDNYKQYKYQFLLPEINNNYYIEDAYLFLRLKNGMEETFKIGSFNYYLFTENLNLKELSGKRYSDFPTLSEVNIKFLLEEDIFIDHLFLSEDNFVYVGESLSNDELLEIPIPKQDKIIDQLSLKVTYQLNGSSYITILPYYLFYETNENPLDYSFINNVYILD